MNRETLTEKLFKFLAIFMIILCPMVLLLCFKVVKQYKRAVILRFGRVRSDSPAGPGIIWVVPCTDSVMFIDLRTQSFNLLPQEILTKDSVTVTVDAVIYCHVLNPSNCLLNVQSYKYATEMLAIAILRNILGQYTLTDLLTNRELISHAIRNEIDKGTAEWGVEVERVEIKDVILPYELQKAMAAEAEGTRIGKAKIIEAEGEIKAAENLRAASKIMIEKPQTILHQSQFTFVGTKINMHHKNESQENVNEERSLSKTSTPTDLKKSLSDIAQSQRSPIQPIQEESILIEKAAVLLSIVIAIITFPFCLLFIFMVVRQFEKAIILRNGRVLKNHAFGPGLIFYLPCVDSIKLVDIRTFCYAVPPQEVLTKDALTVSVDAVVFYKIFDPILAIISVIDYRLSTHFLAATTLRNALGTIKLTEVLANRPAVSHQVFKFMKNITRNWGIEVVRVEIKDISLPLQLQKAMATEAESTRLANAKIIVAKAEIESTKNLQLATDILMDNPMCMQLRYLQSLQTIAGEKTHTIVLPFSPDLVKNIFCSK